MDRPNRWKAALDRDVVVPVMLVVLGLIPIGLWIAMAASLEPVGLGRSLGRAILVVLAPGAVAGLLMLAGAAFFARTRRAGRILATVGAGIIVAGVGFLALTWLERVSRCDEATRFCADRLAEGLGGLAYALLHAALIVLLWRGFPSASRQA
jgi:hypothetical protein